MFDPLDRFLYTIAIAITIQCGLYYFFRSSKKEDFKEKILLLGFGSLWFWYGISSTIFFINSYLVEGFYIGNVFYISSLENLNEINMTISLIAHILNAIGYLLFFLTFEIATKRTHYMLPLYQLVVSIICFLFSPTLNTVFALNSIVLVALIFFWLSKNTRDDLQGFTIAMTIGLLIFYFGTIIDAGAFFELELFPTWFPALFIIAGALITLLPTIINPERFSQPLFFWTLFSITDTLIISAMFYLLTFWSQLSIIVLITGMIGFIFLIIILGFGINRIFRIIKPLKVLRENTTQKEKVKDLVITFIKPQRVTEEEVSISKEKKICLVCKSKLSKQIYLCSDCGAFYCLKCSEALTESENLCWACNTPFDESLPSKTFKEDGEEEIELDKTQIFIEDEISLTKEKKEI